MGRGIKKNQKLFQVPEVFCFTGEHAMHSCSLPGLMKATALTWAYYGCTRIVSKCSPWERSGIPVTCRKRKNQRNAKSIM